MADDNGDNGNGERSGITRWSVSSSTIASLAYDNDAGEAVFTFHRGSPREYRVPISRQQATAWAFSASPGAYFNENIKGMF